MLALFIFSSQPSGGCVVKERDLSASWLQQVISQTSLLSGDLITLILMGYFLNRRAHTAPGYYYGLFLHPDTKGLRVTSLVEKSLLGHVGD